MQKFGIHKSKDIPHFFTFMEAVITFFISFVLFFSMQLNLICLLKERWKGELYKCGSWFYMVICMSYFLMKTLIPVYIQDTSVFIII
jgi:hypothetical protein